MSARVQVTCIGTGEAFDPDLPNTSLLYQGRRTLLLDCGYSVPEAFWRQSRDPDLLDGVYLSHRHADHSFGLPGLLYWMHLAGRRRPLVLLGGPELEPWVSELLDFAYPGAFDTRFFPIERRALVPGHADSFGPLCLRTAVSQHGVVNTALAIEDAGHRLCYSGDGAPTPETRELYAGATVLVHECFAMSQPPAGHADAATLLAMADPLRVGTLALVHVSRDAKSGVRDLVTRSNPRCRTIVPGVGERLSLMPG
ncbi:MBL fold metallo-hydrolase [Myxococcota bacterium]